MPSVLPSPGISSASEGTGVRGQSTSVESAGGSTHAGFETVMTSALAAGTQAGTSARGVSASSSPAVPEKTVAPSSGTPADSSQTAPSVPPKDAASAATGSTAPGSEALSHPQGQAIPASQTPSAIQASLQALQAGELQTKAIAVADAKGTAPEKAKNSEAAAAGKNAAPAGDKKKSNAEAVGKGSAPGATVALAGLPTGTSNPAVAVAVPVMAATTQQALSARVSEPGGMRAAALSSRGSSAAPVAAGNLVPKSQTLTAVPGQSPGQSLGQNASQASGPMAVPLNGAHVSSAEGKAANKSAVPSVMVQASDPGLQPAEAALPQSEGAGNAGAVAGVVAAQGKALSSAGTMALGGAVVPDAAAHGGKPADKVVATGGPVSSLTASATPMTALHPGAAATPSSPQVSGGGGNPAPVAVSNPYARLDEASAPAVLHASPQQMTVAVHDASLGSLQVQVQSVNGQLAASLATATTAAHTQLSGHLASLSGYLHDQRVDVARVTVAPQSFSSQSGSGQGGGPQSGGSGGQPRQQSYAPPASSPLTEAQPQSPAIRLSLPTASARAAIGSASSIDLHA